jgi:ABC-type phosphate/phosphonate transport system substrate-binding protein
MNVPQMPEDSPLIASLPIYDRPESEDAHDALWSLIRTALVRQGIAAPALLNRAIGIMEGWQSPDLLLGQICNLPYRARLRDRVTLVGACDYGLPDCPPGHYFSHFIVRADDPATDPADCAGYRFAYNEALSNSGWGAPQLWAATRGFAFRNTLATGAHRDSLRAVADGRADIAAIDAVSWRMFDRWEPAAGRVRIIGRTACTAGMTLITTRGRNPRPLFDAATAAIAALPEPHRATLGLLGLVALPSTDYDIPLPQAPEVVAG